MALDGIAGTVFREAAIPGLSDVTSGPAALPTGTPSAQKFPSLTPAQSAANLKAAGATAATAANGSPLTGAAGGALGKTEFLQLLVQEMTNQDPLKPADNTEFIAQLAQFSTLEQMQNMNTGIGTLQGTFQEAEARGLIGVPVTSVSSTTGLETDGTVDKIILGSTTGSDGTTTPLVQVDVNGTPVNLSDIMSIGPGPSTSTTSGSSPSTSLPGTVVPPSSGSGH
jgi:flagellar hook assembly protein FlgD